MPVLGIIASQMSGHLAPPAILAYDSIATTTVSSSVSTITFSSIPSGYTHLQIRSIARGTVAQGEMQTFYRFNSDTGTNYAHHFLRADGSTLYGGSGTSIAQASAQIRYSAANATSGIFGAGVTDILDYKDTSKLRGTS